MPKGRVYLLLLPLLLGLGCQKEDDIVAQLRRENPFPRPADDSGSGILLVTCWCLPLQVPAEVDVTAAPFSSQAAESPAGSADARAKVVSKSGVFPQDQLARWRENGLFASVHPMNDWSSIRQQLVRVGSSVLPQTWSLIRNPAEVAEFQTLWLDESISVFVTGRNADLRGYTLPVGDCVFRVGCMPVDPTAQTKQLAFKIVPVLRSRKAEEKLQRDASGRFQRVVEEPMVIFDQLLLAGTLPENHFVLIGAQPPGQPGIGNIGACFLRRRTGVENYQLVLMLVPQVQTAAEVKSQSGFH